MNAAKNNPGFVSNTEIPLWINRHQKSRSKINHMFDRIDISRLSMIQSLN